MSLTPYRMLAACLLFLPSAASAEALDGAWLLKESLPPDLNYNLLCALDTQAGGLSGQCVAMTDRVLPAAGRMVPGKLSFHYTTDYNGSGLKLDYAGRLAADGSVRGEVQNRIGNGEFSGTPLFSGKTGAISAWKFDVAFQGVSYVLVCFFQPDGQRVGGPCAVTQGSTARISGEAGGGTLRFRLDSKIDGAPVHADFVGAAPDSGTAKGSITAGARHGTFSLDRVGQ